MVQGQPFSRGLWDWGFGADGAEFKSLSSATLRLFDCGQQFPQFPLSGPRCPVCEGL